MLLPTLVIFLSNLVSIQGVQLNFEKQDPTPDNKNTCALLTCEEDKVTDLLYVQSIEIVNIDKNGSKLASFSAQSKDELIADDVSLVSLSFERTRVSVQIAIRSTSICEQGSFMCEVSYMNDELKKRSTLSIIRPNSESSCSAGANDKLESLTATLLRLKSSIDQLQKCSGCQDVIRVPPDFPSEWTLAFGGTANINKSVYDAYKSGAGIPDYVEDGCRQIDSDLPCSNHYRNNDILNKWATVTKAIVALYERKVLVGYMMFNALESDYMNWFRRENLIESSWTDLKTSETNYFSLDGEVRPSANLVRRFFVNKNYGGCPNDWGWLLAVDTNPAPCPYERTPNFPTFLYAKGSRGTNWSTGRVGHADVIAIFVK